MKSSCNWEDKSNGFLADEPGDNVPYWQPCPRYGMKSRMKPAILALLLLPAFLILPASATPATATLTAVNEAGFNRITLEFEPPVLPAGSDTSRLSGTIEVLLEIDPETDEVSEMSIIEGNIQGSEIEMSASVFLLGSYDLESSTLDAILDTPNPPGIVNPATGEFDSSQHSFTVVSGDLSGEISTLLTGTSEISFNFADAPIGGTGIGTGTVTLTPTGSTSTSKSYDVDVRLPIAVDEIFEAEGFEIPIRAEGTAKMVGSTTIEIVPEDPFTAWAEQNNLAGTTRLEDSNGDGVPNGIQWALGLEASDNPYPHLLAPNGTTDSSVNFAISLPPDGTAAPLLVVTASDPSEPFVPLGGVLINRGNPIPAGSTGLVTIRLPRGEKGFLQLVVAE